MGLRLGITLGVVIGLLTGHLAIGIALCVVFGMLWQGVGTRPESGIAASGKPRSPGSYGLTTQPASSLRA